MTMDDDDDRMLIPDSTVPEVSNEVVQNQTEATEVQQNFLRIGITLIVLGLKSIVLAAINLSICWFYFCDIVSSGTWSGVFAVLLGSLAIAARYHLNKGVVIANIVSASLAVLFGFINVVLSVISGFEFLINDGSVTVLSFCQTMLSIAWVTLSLYHLIVMVRIAKQGDNDPNCCSSYCCLGSGMGGSEVPIAYVPPAAEQANAQLGQTVFMAVPAYNARPTA